MAIQYPTNGNKSLGYTATDECNNQTRGTRMIQIIQNLIAGRYVNITESGETATISVDPSHDYYNKNEVDELIGDNNGYTKAEADAKFQQKLSFGSMSRLSDDEYVTKIEPDTKNAFTVTGLGIWLYIKDKVTGSISDIVEDNLERSRAIVTDAFGKLNISGVYSAELEQLSGIDTTKSVQSQLDSKQEELTDGEEITSLSDNSTASMVGLSTKKVSPIKMQTIWNYVKGKMTGAISSVIDSDLTPSRVLTSYSNGKIGVANTTQTEIEYLHNVANSLAITEATGANAIAWNSSVSAGLSNLADYDTNVPRRAWKMGGIANLSFQAKGTAAANGANWTTIGTVPSAYKPKYTTPIVAMVYNGTNNDSAGGYIHTDGRVVIWTNSKAATNNYQVRVNVTYRIGN